MGTNPPDARSAPHPQEPPGKGRYLLFFLALALGVAAIGLRYAQYLEGEVREATFRQLETVAALKVRQVSSWREERLGDGNLMAHNAALAALVRRVLQEPRDAEDLQALEDLLEACTTRYHYDAAYLFDDQGVSRLAYPQEAGAGAEILARPAAEALRSGRVTVLDFYVDPNGAGARLALLVPLRDRRTSTRPVAVLALRIDPQRDLYPALEQWPSESSTAETLLVRREGNEVVVLNELRNLARTALRLRMPLEKTQRLAVQAILGQEGPVEGFNYRGQPVLGVVRAVPDSPWHLVAGLELPEVQARWWARVRGFSLSGALLLALAATGLALLWRGQQGWFYRRQAELGAALQATADQLEGLLTTSPTLLFELRPVDGLFLPVSISRNVERLLGYTVEEALQPDWWDRCVHPEDRDRAVENTQNLRDVDAVENEYRFFRKDGTMIWMHDRLEVVRREGGLPVAVTGASNDVTARHEAETALKEGEERLRLALEAANQGLYDADLQTGMSILSPEAAALYGFPRETRRVSTEFWEEGLHPEDQDRVRAETEDYLAGRSSRYHLELRRRQPDGSWRWVLAQGRLVSFTPDGRPLRMLGTLTDIDTRKKAELRSERLAHLYAALSQCNEAILRCRSEAELFPRVCEAAVTHGGMALAGISMVDPETGAILPVASRGEGREYLANLDLTLDGASHLGQGQTAISIRENRPYWALDYRTDPGTAPWAASGARFGWVSSASLPLTREGRPVGALGLYARSQEVFDEEGRRLLEEMARNVSFALDLFASEARRKEAEAALHVKDLALESAMDAIAIADLEGRLTWVNPAFLALWGHACPAEVLGRPASSFWQSPEEAEEVLEAVQLQGTWAGEMEARTSQGALVHLLVTASLVLDPAGQPVCMLGTFSDITERRQAEAALRTSLREKEALLLEVHHRVKNNLQVISSLLRLEGRRSALPEVRSVLGEMQSRVASMALLHEILYRSGNLAQVDLASYLTRLGHQIARSMAPARVQLHVDVAPVQVELDQAVPCGLLVNELVSNALKHGFPGNRSGEVWLRLHPPGEGPGLRLEVSDTGVGLPDDFEERSAHSLGLQLVRDLARQVRGTLEIDPGPGARFALVFVPKVPEPESGA